jgi:hypothetical protein
MGRPEAIATQPAFNAFPGVSGVLAFRAVAPGSGPANAKGDLMAKSSTCPPLAKLLEKLSFHSCVLKNRLDRKTKRGAVVDDVEEDVAATTQEAFDDAIDWAAVKAKIKRDDIRSALAGRAGRKDEGETDIQTRQALDCLDSDGTTQELFDAMREEHADILEAIGMLPKAEIENDVTATAETKGGQTPQAEVDGGTDIEREAATADGPWSKPDGPKQWAKAFNCSPSTLKRRFEAGTIRHKKLSSKSYCIHVDDLPKQPPPQHFSQHK